MPVPDNQQLFPLATVKPFVSGDPFLGGQIVILPVAAANANATFTHALKRLPRAFLVLDLGTQNFPIVYGGTTAPPFSRGTTAWTHALFSLVLPALTTPVVGVLF